MNTTIRKLVRQLKDQGCRIEPRGGGHIKVTLPNGNFVFISATPSDRRAEQNMMRDLRKAGLPATEEAR